MKPKPKAVNKPSHHSIMHGLDKPGVFTTVSVLENWGVSSALLVPAKVDLLWFEGPIPVLSYLLPAHWIPEVFWLSLQLPEGWSLKREPSDVLTDFLALAHEKMTEKSIDQVKAFAEKWGPLWICRNPAHLDCHYVIGGGLYRANSSCKLGDVEEVQAFQREALAAQAALEIARILWDNKNAPRGEQRPIPQHLLSRLRPGGWGDKLLDPQRCLTTTINLHLSAYGGPTLSLLWPAQALRPTLSFISGFGFIHTVWVEIAQIMAHAHGILQCDGCKRIYVRERRAKKGQKNFCRTCGDRAAKRLSAQGKRAREGVLRQQALQLLAAGVPLEDMAHQLAVDVEKVHQWTRPRRQPGRPRKTTLAANRTSS